MGTCPYLFIDQAHYFQTAVGGHRIESLCQKHHLGFSVPRSGQLSTILNQPVVGRAGVIDRKQLESSYRPSIGDRSGES